MQEKQHSFIAIDKPSDYATHTSNTRHMSTETVRLAKYIAQSGYCARRKAEELITAGAVSVNGERTQVVTTFITPGRDTVTVFGKPIEPVENHLYVLVHKPSGYISTTANERRKKVTDLVPQEVVQDRRLFLVGRLDRETEGLLLLTDDGALAQRMTHPSFEKEKEYEVIVRGDLTAQKAKQLQEGVHIMVDDEAYLTAPATLSHLSSNGKISKFHLILKEGKKRQIRLMCAAVGCPVRYLRRIRMGNLKLGSLPLKGWRMLTSEEVTTLR